jgi:hypothetical protein
MRALSKNAICVISGLAMLMLGGCVSPVQPWEKSTLAESAMKPAGTVPALVRIDGHIYYSREAVRGGTGVGGGGCGCN